MEQVLVLAQSFLLSLVPLPSSSVKRLIRRAPWLVPSKAETECALALVSARLELVGEPPGLVEGAVGGEALHGVLLWVICYGRGRHYTSSHYIIET